MALTALMLIFLACGCSPESHYKTLSFFFDGVPPPGGTPADSGAGGRKENAGETEQKKNLFSKGLKSVTIL